MAQSRILIVDDDLDLTSALKAVLEANQYAVATAPNREEGMEKVASENPDLIILDVMMEAWQDGFEMARNLKENDQYKSIPILMLTGVEGQTGIDFKTEAGDENWLPVEGFLNKPVEPATLLDEVKKVLGK